MDLRIYFTYTNTQDHMNGTQLMCSDGRPRGD